MSRAARKGPHAAGRTGERAQGSAPREARPGERAQGKAPETRKCYDPITAKDAMT